MTLNSCYMSLLVLHFLCSQTYWKNSPCSLSLQFLTFCILSTVVFSLSSLPTDSQLHPIFLSPLLGTWHYWQLLFKNSILLTSDTIVFSFSLLPLLCHLWPSFFLNANMWDSDLFLVLPLWTFLVCTCFYPNLYINSDFTVSFRLNYYLDLNVRHTISNSACP